MSKSVPLLKCVLKTSLLSTRPESNKTCHSSIQPSVFLYAFTVHEIGGVFGQIGILKLVFLLLLWTAAKLPATVMPQGNGGSFEQLSISTLTCQEKH